MTRNTIVRTMRDRVTPLATVRILFEGLSELPIGASISVSNPRLTLYSSQSLNFKSYSPDTSSMEYGASLVDDTPSLYRPIRIRLPFRKRDGIVRRDLSFCPSWQAGFVKLLVYGSVLDVCDVPSVPCGGWGNASRAVDAQCGGIVNRTDAQKKKADGKPPPTSAFLVGWTGFEPATP